MLDVVGRKSLTLYSVGFVASGKRYGNPTELPEAHDPCVKVSQNPQKFRVVWHGRTGLTEVSGPGINLFTTTTGSRFGDKITSI